MKIKANYDKIRKHKKTNVFLIAMLLFTAQAIVTLYQKSRYSPDYCCRHMSRDVEGFFEFLGIDTYIVTGMKYDEDNKTSYFRHHNDLYYGEWESGHMWCELDIFGIRIPYESTSLFLRTRSSDEYDTIQRCDGYFTNGKWSNFNENDNITWEKIK